MVSFHQILKDQNLLIYISVVFILFNIYHRTRVTTDAAIAAIFTALGSLPVPKKTVTRSAFRDGHGQQIRCNVGNANLIDRRIVMIRRVPCLFSLVLSDGRAFLLSRGSVSRRIRFVRTGSLHLPLATNAGTIRSRGSTRSLQFVTSRGPRTVLRR